MRKERKIFILAIIKVNIGGEYLTRQMIKVMQSRQQFDSRFRNRDENSASIEEWGRLEIARDLKESLCKVLEQPIGFL